MKLVFMQYFLGNKILSIKFFLGILNSLFYLFYRQVFTFLCLREITWKPFLYAVDVKKITWFYSSKHFDHLPSVSQSCGAVWVPLFCKKVHLSDAVPVIVSLLRSAHEYGIKHVGWVLLMWGLSSIWNRIQEFDFFFSLFCHFNWIIEIRNEI